MPVGVDTEAREFATCRSCGQTHLPENGLRCRSCGNPLLTPVHVYRRNRSGEWERIRELDFTRHLPLPPPRPRKRRMHRWALLILLPALPGGMLWGWSWKLQREVAQQQPEADAYRSRGVGVIPVRMEATAELVAGGKLVIRGHTNLPDGTLLQARVRRNTTVLAQDYPIVVSGGQFHSAELANRGRSFRPGEYQIHLLARFAPTAQPHPVFDIVGPGGKKLTGPLVESSGENPSAKLIAFQGAIRLR